MAPAQCDRRRAPAVRRRARQHAPGLVRHDRAAPRVSRGRGGPGVSVIPYLNLNGRCAEALAFYGEALGATTESVATFGESPMAEQTPPEWRDKVMHAGFTVAGSRLYAGDGPPGGKKPISGVTFSIITDDVAEAERMFNALAAGGEVGMKLQETFWAERFGMVTDQFGVPWMVNGAPKQSG